MQSGRTSDRTAHRAVASPRPQAWRRVGRGVAAGAWAVALLAASPLMAQDVRLRVDAAGPRKPISPWIYGKNENGNLTPLTAVTSRRLGGNRWTAYNWETNASNAGADWYFFNDGYLSASNVPGEAIRPTLQSTTANHQAMIVTVPMAGYVAGDKLGTTVQVQDYATVNPTDPVLPGNAGPRFKTIVNTKPSSAGPLSLTPDPNDAFVYTDEYVNWVRHTGGNRRAPLMFSLDNEPDLWFETHRQIRWNPATNSAVKVTYDELRRRTINTASAIKSVMPDAVVLGAVNYGWHGYRTLQDAPDRAGRDFHRYFLQEMRNAEIAHGRRLVDAIDIHYYPEARGTYTTGGEERIVFGSAMTSTDPGIIAARVQAPRSLWDPTYVETSWITQWSTGGQPMRTLARLQEDIDTFYPGTKIAVTEYSFGGGNHISGATAQADVLGIFGRMGVYAANLWDLHNNSTDNRFVRAAFNMYLNYDGQGGRFGDVSLTATNTDWSKASIYASVDEAQPGRVVLVVINKTANPLTAELQLDNFGLTFTSLRAWQLAGTSTTPQLVLNLTSVPATPTVTLQPYAVMTVQLWGYATIPEPGSLALLAAAAALNARPGRR